VKACLAARFNPRSRRYANGSGTCSKYEVQCATRTSTDASPTSSAQSRPPSNWRACPPGRPRRSSRPCPTRPSFRFARAHSARQARLHGRAQARRATAVLLLDPARVTRPPDEAASSRVAATDAPRVSISELRPIDLIVCGSVAVNRNGERIGKGAGYSDLEVALLHDAGLIGPRTVIATTVHPLQVLDESLPTADHDFEVDLIATPDEVILCRPSQQRTGILWDQLPAEYIKTIPVLGSLSPRHLSSES
jgi:5-formyltetrahydrofolate cyclo-ligase